MSYQYFTKKEVGCRCGCGGLPTDEFMGELHKLRVAYGKPMRITSGYRCPAYNKAVGGSPKSQHVEGRAVDIQTTGADNYALVSLAQELGFKGIGVAKTFLHVDTRPTQTGVLWGY